MSRVAVVVPMFNEATVVGPVIDSLVDRFDLIVCVDDGSIDASGIVAAACGAVVLRHPVNLGQGAALRTGFEYLLTRPDIQHVVTFDADGQHDPDDAQAMVRVAQATGVHAVLGTRAHERPAGQPWLRRYVLRAGLLVSKVTTGLELTDTHNGLRVFSRFAVSVLVFRQRGMAYASELESLIARHHLAWIEHPVTITYSSYSRAKGQRNLNAFNILYDMIAARLLAR